jgi:hypothetical protein
MTSGGQDVKTTLLAIEAPALSASSSASAAVCVRLADQAALEATGPR